MSKELLDIYLNDHLAGSVGALELIDHLLSSHEENTLRSPLISLREDIESDQSVLRALMSDLALNESAVRKAGAWIAEKLSRAKLQLGSKDDPFGLFQAFEGLCLGIAGKKALWEALSTVANTALPLGKLDYPKLIRRATDQFERVNAMRIELCREVLAPGASVPSYA